jgi:HAD superfamily hydrolase (TIGR01509 family)
MNAARGPYRAVIFDMDGVLVDSEPAFFEAANQVLSQEGHSIEFERYQRLLGTSVEVTWRGLIEMLGLQGNLKDYLRRYHDVLLECLRRPRPPLPGVLELLEELDSRGASFGLATSSWRTWKDAVLESAGLQGRFRTIVTGDTVEHEKPAPDLYLKAAELLETPPGQCMAVEDTPPGIRSAKAAGMYAVHVRSSSTAFPPIEEADLVLDSLAQFPLSMIEAT